MCEKKKVYEHVEDKTELVEDKGVASESETEDNLENEEDLNAFFEQVIAYGNEVLQKTPDMLPVLKQARVG